jgi:hypothetical protein
VRRFTEPIPGFNVKFTLHKTTLLILFDLWSDSRGGNSALQLYLGAAERGIERVEVKHHNFTPAGQIRVVSAGLCAPAHRRPPEEL